MTGSTSDLLDASHTGRSFSCMQKIMRRNVANTKDGIAVKSVVMNMIRRSGHRFLKRAAIAPNTTPRISAQSAASPPIVAETLKHSKIVPVIARPVFSETPKSPRRIFPI